MSARPVISTWKPLAVIPDDEIVRILNALKNRALQEAMTKYLADVKMLVIRPLRPRDLGIASDEWTFNVAAGTNQNIINVDLDDKTMVIIYGVANRSTDPVVNEVLFKTGAETIADFYIEEMYLYPVPAAIFDEMIIYSPGSPVRIDFVARAASTAEKFMLLGWVIEPAGRRIGSA